MLVERRREADVAHLELRNLELLVSGHVALTVARDKMTLDDLMILSDEAVVRHLMQMTEIPTLIHSKYFFLPLSF